MPAGLGVATRSLFRGSIPPEAPDRPPYVSREKNRKISACCQEGGEEIFGGAAAYAWGSAGGEAPNWRTALSHAFAQPSAAAKSASSVSAGSEMNPRRPAGRQGFQPAVWISPPAPYPRPPAAARRRSPTARSGPPTGCKRRRRGGPPGGAAPPPPTRPPGPPPAPPPRPAGG